MSTHQTKQMPRMHRLLILCRTALVISVVGVVSACVPATPEGQTAALPETLSDIVAPGQDVSTLRVQADGCYWWLYRGVVEDTYIPLETRDGRMICTRGQGVAVDDL